MIIKIGKPIMGYARASNTLFVPLKMLSWASKSGPEWFLFPHIIDLARWLTGKEIEEVYATGKKEVLKNKGIDAYDIIQAQVEFEDSISIFESSWILPTSWRNELIEFRMEIYGEKGRFPPPAQKSPLWGWGDKTQSIEEGEFVKQSWLTHY